MIDKSIESFGYTEFYKEQVKVLNIGDKGLIPARIVAVYRDQYKIVTQLSEKTARL